MPVHQQDYLQQDLQLVPESLKNSLALRSIWQYFNQSVRLEKY